MFQNTETNTGRGWLSYSKFKPIFKNLRGNFTSFLENYKEEDTAGIQQGGTKLIIPQEQNQVGGMFWGVGWSVNTTEEQVQDIRISRNESIIKKKIDEAISSIDDDTSITTSNIVLYFIYEVFELSTNLGKITTKELDINIDNLRQHIGAILTCEIPIHANSECLTVGGNFSQYQYYIFNDILVGKIGGKESLINQEAHDGKLFIVEPREREFKGILLELFNKCFKLYFIFYIKEYKLANKPLIEEDEPFIYNSFINIFLSFFYEVRKYSNPKLEEIINLEEEIKLESYESGDSGSSIFDSLLMRGSKETQLKKILSTSVDFSEDNYRTYLKNLNLMHLVQGDGIFNEIKRIFDDKDFNDNTCVYQIVFVNQHKLRLFVKSDEDTNSQGCTVQ